jgi:hypothetical protein
MSVPGLNCESEKLSFNVDSLPARAWPVTESVRIDGLRLDVKHRVVLFCNGKAHQSFTFRYSDYRTRKLCLFINDLYKTGPLWEDKQSPWCKCKSA